MIDPPGIVRCGGRITAVITLFGAVAACDAGPTVDVPIVFDGQHRTISTSEVICTRQPDGSLVIVATDGTKHTIRVLLRQQGHLTVLKAGLRYEELSGFVADPDEASATKIDDTFTISGRMPPNTGEIAWHTFEIETTCRAYREADRNDTVPRMGTP